MSLNEIQIEIESAIIGGASQAELLAIVSRYKGAGLSQRQVYDGLETIWKKVPSKAPGDNSAREALEVIMDRVWGYCKKSDAIWGATAD